MLLAAGCGKPSNENAYRDATQDDRIERLQMSVDYLREQVKSMSGNQSAILTPDEKGFTFVSDGVVSATVSLTSLKQEGSAVRANLQIGNLSSGTLHKCWLVVSVRKSKDGPFQDGKVRDIAGKLLPGTYNNSHVVIPDVKVEEISALEVSSIQCGSIILNV